ncbi:MAG: DNA starvation/stationary phase protection protein [Acetobacter sp.]|nr:DNA starvation/stationary phase protection protein [Acetobacter sp.]MCH4062032.1 DNA starvation/stationary phase protection protein [Acetobacter sp.]MCH4089119.1 DNA starvation/stationary phase protection protein [Acetobacter sp.]MCI1293155.1 DNA starvation/stationary phase protection protein [Acetobacter sp.]MCI1320220.1 DNA starvation/stationary phase protection protein [Acetobacter sp.]
MTNPINAKDAQIHHHLGTPSDIPADSVRDVSAALRALLADIFALYLKTKNFHWHLSGRHFRDYHLMLDEQSDQIFAMTDPVAERARKIGGLTLHSIGEIARLQRIKDNDAAYVTPQDMLAELAEDNKQLCSELRALHALTSAATDIGTTTLLEEWIEETERRTWFLFESSRNTTGEND